MKASMFKNNAAKKSLEDWIDFYVAKSDLDYQKLDVFTSYGSTRLLSINHEKQELKPILFIPGARTCGIFWDLNNHLHLLGDNYRIYLLDVLGQPGLSDGACLKVKDESFGLWLREVCREIRFKKGICVGASFGGELIIKLAAVAPGKIEKAVLMNPIGFSYINLNPKNLYYTLLPVYFPTRKNIEKFFNRIVFTPEMRVPAETLEKVCDFTENILKFFEFNAEYPYKMQDDELKKLRAETHLFVGAKDALIPQNKTIERARKLLPNLKSVEVFPQTGHGIELSTDAILKLKAVLAN